jgi:hypothetical protein
MNSQTFAFWIDLFASLASVFGLGAVAYQLSRARKAELRQFQFDTFKMFSIDLKDERAIEYQLNRSSLDEFKKEMVTDPAKANAYKNILDFYSLIASAAKSKSINRKDAFRTWGQPMISFWNRYEELFLERRSVMGEEAFSDLEWFKTMSEKTHPEFAENFEQMKREGMEMIKKYQKDEENKA